MKHLLLTTALVLSIASTPALAAKSPRTGQTDPRVKSLTYNENEVYRLTAHYGFTTVLEFHKNERIVTIAIGDIEGWQLVQPSGLQNFLFVKPIKNNANTNMTVVTSERVYSFEMNANHAQSHRSNELSFRIKFNYPMLLDQELADIGKKKNKGFDPKEFSPSNIEPEDWNFKYSYAGDKRLLPHRAFDDGMFTYFEFSDKSVTPAIFAVDEKGNESIVNYAIRGKYLVVETLSKQFTLRDGETSTCIFNDGMGNGKNTQMSLNDMEDVSAEVMASNARGGLNQ